MQRSTNFITNYTINPNFEISTCNKDTIVNDPSVQQIFKFAEWMGIPVCFEDTFWRWQKTDAYFHIPLGSVVVKFSDSSSLSEVVCTLLHEISHAILKMVDDTSRWLRKSGPEGDIMSLIEECSADKVAVYLSQVFGMSLKESMIKYLGPALDSYASDVTDTPDYGRKALTEMFDTPFSSQLRCSAVIIKLVINYKAKKKCLYKMLDTVYKNPRRYDTGCIDAAKRGLDRYRKCLIKGNVYGYVIDPKDYPPEYLD